MSRRDAAYVANVLGKSENWVKRNAHRYPHHRAGQTVFWTDEDVAEILTETRVVPNPRPDGVLRPVTGRRAVS